MPHGQIKLVSNFIILNHYTLGRPCVDKLHASGTFALIRVTWLLPTIKWIYNYKKQQQRREYHPLINCASYYNISIKLIISSRIASCCCFTWKPWMIDIFKMWNLSWSSLLIVQSLSLSKFVEKDMKWASVIQTT